MLESVFERTIVGLIPETETALLAVSGGIDSMCMASLFLRASRGRKFSVAHCNFHLRGVESDSDEALVAGWCEANGVRLHKADFDTEHYAVSHGISIEMAARELRYDWFAELCRDNGYYAVCVAHNANDNAETLILNLLRGTGLRGLAGMKAESVVPVSRSEIYGVRLVRPLLSFTRRQLEEYASATNLQYHNDHTNDETVYKRNRIRHNVFPVFESINPSFLQTFGQEMRLFSQEESIADDYYQSVKQRVIVPLRSPEERARVSLTSLLKEKHWEYVLYRTLEAFGYKGRLLEPVIRLLKHTSGTLSGKVFEAPGYKLSTESGYIVVRESAVEVEEHRKNLIRSGRNLASRMCTIVENDVCAMVEGEAGYRIDGQSVNVSVERVENKDVQALARSLMKERIAVADASVLKFPFLLRRWMPGDWMRPLGLKGRKKLSDIFTDMKISREDKDKALVVVLPSRELREVNEAVNSGANIDAVADIAGGEPCRNGISSSGVHVAAVFGCSSGEFYCRIDDCAKVTDKSSGIVKIRLNGNVR